MLCGQTKPMRRIKKDGYILYYETKKSKKEWKKRFAILNDDCKLCVFKDNTLKNPINETALQSTGCEVTQKQDPSGKVKCFIQILTPSSGKLLKIGTEAPQEVNYWHEAIRASLHSAQKFHQQEVQDALKSYSAVGASVPSLLRNLSESLKKPSSKALATEKSCHANTQGEAVTRSQVHHPSCSPSLPSLKSTGSQFCKPTVHQMENQMLQSDVNSDRFGDKLHWKTSALVGRGGFGDVYKGCVRLEHAWHDCAIKVIRLPMQADSSGAGTRTVDVTKMVEGEQNLCELSHPNIVKFLGIECAKDFKVLLFMELLDGDTLEAIVNGQPLREARIREYGVQICLALQYIHSRQPPVIHRDINGSNIIVLRAAHRRETPVVKLIDFGLSMTLKEASHHSSLSENPKGTINFMAPEMLALENDQDRVKYSTESDIWAFGCTVYQMATGCRPHSGCKCLLSMAMKLNNDGAPALPVDDAISDDLRDFYGKCTAWERKDRWSAQRLLEHKFLLAESGLAELANAQVLSTYL